MKTINLFALIAMIGLSLGFACQSQARVMCCPTEDKCGAKPDKCSPKAVCQPKDSCSNCPDGTIEKNVWWKVR
ncbi:MAG: hypothetical protein SFT81_03400 [Candidatus Caenarcaniphilales bacterium]|nr:hypothetical protein [Candidatus Caenarcaniphilales bacterium]